MAPSRWLLFPNVRCGHFRSDMIIFDTERPIGRETQFDAGADSRAPLVLKVESYHQTCAIVKKSYRDP